MNATKFWTVVFTAALVLGCKNSKYCDTSTPTCPSGLKCDPVMHACVVMDGGAGGMGGSGGAGGKTDGGGDVKVSCPEIACVGHDGGSSVCDVDAGICVDCLIDMDCKDTTRPICGANHVCRGCMATPNECATHVGRTACASGTCVECASSSDCTADPKKPICNVAGGNICRTCQADAECVAKGATDPGVCMAQTDGHCAMSAETIYVQNSTSGTATCSDTATTAGTANQPFCSMQPVPAALSSILDLVVVRGTVSGGTAVFMGQGAPMTSIVGEQSAFIASGASPALSMQSGSVYIRALKFSSSGSTGISATGGTLLLDTVLVDGCPTGGVFLDGTQFDLENTTVENSGPSSDLSWGGIRVQNLPTGPSNVFKLNLVTIRDNKAPGLSCSSSIVGIGVFASGNTTGNVVSACGVTACPIAGAGCGAQP